MKTGIKGPIWLPISWLSEEIFCCGKLADELGLSVTGSGLDMVSFWSWILNCGGVAPELAAAAELSESNLAW